MSIDEKGKPPAELQDTGAPKPRPESLSGAQRRFLRAQAHHLKPVVFIGKGGVNEGVVAATADALKVHELIKVSAPSEGNAQRRAIAQEMSDKTGSHVVQTIGHIVVLFRQKGQRSDFKLPMKNA